jgi:lipopolysaccharide heptosyltransferase II
MSTWKDCKNILCVRLDNMGDLLMSAPAITSLKESFKCKITVLTSSMAAPVASYIPAIDEVMTFDVPWVKSAFTVNEKSLYQVIDALKEKDFDAAVTFTVFSQNPMATFLITWLAKIPRRAGYCRENPYELLTDWLPDPEPYSTIRHQVKRDLELVKHLGATPYDRTIPLRLEAERYGNVQHKLLSLGLNIARPWLIIHPGVSESKREFPEHLWVEVGKKIANELNHQVVVTGSRKELNLTDRISKEIGNNAFAAGGTFTLPEFLLLIHQSPLVITVNTSTAHIAAATQTKVIVLYALTNPQHAPWKSIGRIFPYKVEEQAQSKNEVLKFLQTNYFTKTQALPTADEIVSAAFELLTDVKNSFIPELVGKEESIPIKE